MYGRLLWFLQPRLLLGLKDIGPEAFARDSPLTTAVVEEWMDLHNSYEWGSHRHQRRHVDGSFA